GQGYIIDSFLVVVLGGVGQLAGSVAGGVGVGLFKKNIEPPIGAVLGNNLIMVGNILFIHKPPQGLLALKPLSLINNTYPTTQPEPSRMPCSS
ncbi:hypothetical protein ACVGV8_00385, partial [Enterobacter intestinihominis]